MPIEPSVRIDRVLEVRGLTVEFDTPRGTLRAVDSLDFDLYPGEVLGVVGESGSGKSATVLSMLRLLPIPPGRIAAGSVRFGDVDLLRTPFAAMRRILGQEIAMVFQDPMTALNPAHRIGHQIGEAIRTHNSSLSRRRTRSEAIRLLALVGIPDPSSRYRQYPHQFSGGMRQRVMIAMAIANRPKVIVADEATTALDVTIQAQVLDVLREARRETGAATILITHDLGLIAEMADRVMVMYAGRAVEKGLVEHVFSAPRHPYTLGLMASRPRLEGHVERLLPIPGQPPTMIGTGAGCAFQPRCPLSRDRAVCAESVPPLRAVGQAGQSAACHFADEMADEVDRVVREVGVDLTAGQS